jgi:hypothetical protein
LVAEGVLLESAGLKNVEAAESATDPSSTVSTKSGALAAGNTMVLAGFGLPPKASKGAVAND